MSPWVRELCSIRARTSSLFLCKACGSNFFSLRYTEEQLSRLYDQYRGDHYLAIRSKWEPTYDERTNRSLGEDTSVIEQKRESIRQLIKTHKKVIDGLTFIDVGGDQGQFIPPEVKVKLLYDISSKDLVPDVHRVAELSDERWSQVDVVIMSGVLEHLPSPRNVINSIARLVKPGTLFYIEVPAGLPSEGASHYRLTPFLIAFVASFKQSLWQRIDQWQARERLAGRTSSKRFLRQSEHLNFFSLEGIRALVASVGLVALTAQEAAMPAESLASGRVSFASNLCVVARKEKT